VITRNLRNDMVNFRFPIGDCNGDRWFLTVEKIESGP
jgi:hypothetical protein